MRRTSNRGSLIAVGLGTAALALATVAPAVAQEDAKIGVTRDNDWLLAEDLADGNADHAFGYGHADDVTHLMGDWNGDGTRTPGIVRIDGDFTQGDGPFDLVWHLRNSNSSGDADIVVRFGEARNQEELDHPVVGDWNGDGTETIGYVRPDYDGNVHQWRLRNDNSDGAADISFNYGRVDSYGRLAPEEPRGVPVVGDWDGDGTTTPGIVRQVPSENSSTWLLRDSNDAGWADTAYRYARADDRVLAGDWDGDGVVTPGVFRENRWLLRDEHAGGSADHDVRYGRQADTPVVWR